MGGRGTAAIRNRNSSSETSAPATKYNKQGFEVESTNSPELEFSEDVWKKMADLRALGHFRDPDLRSLVDDRISELVDQYGDLEAYDADLTNLKERVENDAVTEDEYWAAYHTMADYLDISSPRYIAGESGEDYGYTDTRFGLEEEAAEWGKNRNLTHVIDTWTGKYRKINGKNWRS